MLENVEHSSHHDEIAAAGINKAALEAASQPKTFVTFDISGQTFGVEVSFVREILDHIDIARVPNTRSEINGIIDIRNESVPIMDIGSQLGMHHLETGTETRIIIFEIFSDGKAKPIGILADRVRDVTQIPPSEIETPPDAIGGIGNGSVLSGLARHDDLLIALLDIEAILTLDSGFY
ncbi:MAG: chemotaxis protein CheW [Pseudomonadota bacterium]